MTRKMMPTICGCPFSWPLFLAGAYETDEADPPSPTPAYGRTKSGRKNVKQIHQGLSVSGDGGLPFAFGWQHQ